MAAIRVLANGRFTANDCGRANGGAALWLADNEVRPITVDWSDYLGADTISSVTNEVTSATLTDAANTTTGASFKIQADGAAIIQHRITTAAGAVKEFPIFINGGQLYSYPVDYC